LEPSTRVPLLASRLPGWPTH